MFERKGVIAVAGCAAGLGSVLFSACKKNEGGSPTAPASQPSAAPALVAESLPKHLAEADMIVFAKRVAYFVKQYGEKGEGREMISTTQSIKYPTYRYEADIPGIGNVLIDYEDRSKDGTGSGDGPGGGDNLIIRLRDLQGRDTKFGDADINGLHPRSERKSSGEELVAVRLNGELYIGEMPVVENEKTRTIREQYLALLRLIDREILEKNHF